MDRGAWWATVHGVARVGYALVTKPPVQIYSKTQYAEQRTSGAAPKTLPGVLNLAVPSAQVSLVFAVNGTDVCYGLNCVPAKFIN